MPWMEFCVMMLTTQNAVPTVIHFPSMCSTSWLLENILMSCRLITETEWLHLGQNTSLQMLHHFSLIIILTTGRIKMKIYLSRQLCTNPELHIYLQLCMYTPICTYWSIVIFVHEHTHTIYICVFVYVCVCERERERERETDRQVIKAEILIQYISFISEKKSLRNILKTCSCSSHRLPQTV